MAQLFVPLTGGFKKAAGSGFNTFGENLDRPQWHGAELGGLDTFPDVWGAVSEAEFHDWIIGVHHPLYKEGGPAWCRFLDPDPTVRCHALDLAATSATAAHHVGARYILFHFPWPGLGRPDALDLGWYFTYKLEDPAAWTEQTCYEASRLVFERMAEIQAKESIKVVLEIDGPYSYFYEGDMFERLFAEYPDLSLCIDTGRMGLLARTHGQDPLALTRRFLPWTRHLHLHTSRWDEQGRFQNHIPTCAAHTADKWPAVTPAADILRLVLEAQPRCTVVLEHDPGLVSPAELEEAHRWVADLVSRA